MFLFSYINQISSKCRYYYILFLLLILMGAFISIFQNAAGLKTLKPAANGRCLPYPTIYMFCTEVHLSFCCLLLLSHSSAEHSEGHPVFAPTPVHVQVHCISRGLRARPFSMTPPCRQPHSPSLEEFILLSYE